jgi:hypothetical protein
MARPRSPLTTFILSLPTTLSVKEVLAQAKSKGMKTTEQNVSRVRKLVGGKSAKSATAKKPAKKSKSSAKLVAKSAAKAPTSKGAGVSKSEFIRQQPATLSANEVVVSAKAAGLKFDQKYVYRIRDLAKGKGGKKKRAAARQRAPHAATVQHAAVRRTHSNDAGHSLISKIEGMLHAIAAEIGLGRALDLLATERARVTALIGR